MFEQLHLDLHHNLHLQHQSLLRLRKLHPLALPFVLRQRFYCVSLGDHYHQSQALLHFLALLLLQASLYPVVNFRHYFQHLRSTRLFEHLHLDLHHLRYHQYHSSHIIQQALRSMNLSYQWHRSPLPFQEAFQYLSLLFQTPVRRSNLLHQCFQYHFSLGT